MLPTDNEVVATGLNTATGGGGDKPAAHAQTEAIAKPDFWFEGFGNDWLTHFYELPSLSEQLPSTLLIYLPKLSVMAYLLALLLLLWWRRLYLQRLQQQLQAYRALALQELGQHVDSINAGQWQQAQHLYAILQRCLLVFTPRQQLATWPPAQRLAWINSLLPSDAEKFTLQELQLLQQLRCRASAEAVNDKTFMVLLAKLRFWIRHHQVVASHAAI